MSRAEIRRSDDSVLALQIIESLPLAICVLDVPSCHILQLNAQAQQVTNVLLGTISESAPQTADEILAAWLRQHGIVARARAVLAAGYPCRNQRIDITPQAPTQTLPSTLHLSYDILPLDSERVTVLLRDVTEEQRERARIEQASFHTQIYAEKLEAALEHLTEGVLVLEAAGTLQTYNRSALHYAFNRSTVERARLHGKRIDPNWHISSPLGVTLTEEELPGWRALQSGEPIVGEQLVIRRQDGDETPVLMSAAPVRNEAGNVEGVVVTFHDMTALKEIERSKDEFISIASHELRQPLTVIQGQAQMLRRRLNRSARASSGMLPEGEALLDLVTGIEGQTARLNGLVSDLLDMSRIQLGELQLEVHPTPLLKLIRHVITQQREVSQAHTLHLHPELPAGIHELTGTWDARRIEQILMNLLSNAIKYSPAGGRVEVRVDVLPAGSAPQTPAPAAQARETGGRQAAAVPSARIRVCDSGIGIPEDALPRLFERFYRARNTVGIQGTGLGLYICRQLAWAHGGNLWAESQGIGKGTTFVLLLPLASDAEA